MTKALDADADLVPKKLTREEFLALKDSELLERVAADIPLALALKDEKGRAYKFNLSVFYGRPGERQEECYICAAGACAVGTLGVRSREEWFTCVRSDAEVATKIDLVSDYALGALRIAADITTAHELKNCRTANDFSPEQSAAYLTDVAAYLKEHGL